MKKLFVLFFLLATSIAFAQKNDRRLEEKIKEAISGFQGDIGIYVKSLRTGKTVTINADTIFPTASIVKVPILLGIMDRINKKELDYDSMFTYKDSLLYAGSDILGSFKSNERIALKKVMMLMLTTSDNTASLWLQSIAGTGTRINEILAELGMKDTRVNSRTPGREDNRNIYGWGQTTPKEMGTIFEKIYRKEVFSPEACDRMMRCLGRNYWDLNEGIGVIPPTIEVFSKNGCVNQSRSEAMIVNAPRDPYVFCIFTKNNKDQQWTHENEAWTMARKISGLLWEYFN